MCCASFGADIKLTPLLCRSIHTAEPNPLCWNDSKAHPEAHDRRGGRAIREPTRCTIFRYEFQDVDWHLILIYNLLFVTFSNFYFLSNFCFLECRYLILQLYKQFRAIGISTILLCCSSARWNRHTNFMYIKYTYLCNIRSNPYLWLFPRIFHFDIP